MTAKRDIYNSVLSTTEIHNSSIVVINPHSLFGIRIDTSYLNETIPDIAQISGKYGIDGSGRFGDITYYG